jgi:hypothetical protein
MSTYRIVCVNTEHPHSHIVKVGTGTKAEHYSRTWTVKEVLEAIEDGDRFYTVSPSTSKEAEVKADTCKIAGCSIKTLRSTADGVKDNNLDYMPSCT